MRCNAFVEAWKNHHRRASMILGLSLLSAPLSYSVYAEDGVSNTMVQVVTQTKTVKGTIMGRTFLNYQEKTPSIPKSYFRFMKRLRAILLY